MHYSEQFQCKCKCKNDEKFKFDMKKKISDRTDLISTSRLLYAFVQL